MASTTQDALIALLRDEGAEPATSERIVDALLTSGLSAAQARVWLTNLNRAHPISTGKGMTVRGEWIEFQQVPTHAIEDGDAQAVLDEARRFAHATDDERRISWLLACDMAHVARLTGHSADRAATIRAVLDALRDRLGTDARVLDAVFTQPRLGPDTCGPRMIDTMLEGRAEELLAAVTDDEIDLQELRSTGLLQVGF